MRKEPCPNCKELVEECACMRNICNICGDPVGNITFAICDKCWDKEREEKKKEIIKERWSFLTKDETKENKKMEYKNINKNILIFAFRYGLGRRTYAVKEIVDMLKTNWNLLEGHTKEQIKHEIRNEKLMSDNFCDRSSLHYDKYIENCWNEILGLE